MIRLYLVRHGIAEDGAPGQPDESRALTGKGRKRFRGGAKAFAALAEEVPLILTSPLVRAVQTAEILVGALGKAEVEVLEELRSVVGEAEAIAAAARRAAKEEAVALVGHNPQLTWMLAALSGVAADQLDFKKGSIVRLDLPKIAPGAGAKPRWWLEPKSEKFHDGLPSTAIPDDD